MPSPAAIDELAKRILKIRLPHPVRVAVDGRTASGKTTFADALAVEIGQGGRHVIRASVDGFHRPRADRHRQGQLSSDGYYEDARDLEAMRRLLLDPLGPGGDRVYVAASFDLDKDIPLAIASQHAQHDDVLIVDGTFLQRPELVDAWDFVIFLEVTLETARRRGVQRDKSGLGGPAAALELHDRRYGPAFVRYEAECRPTDCANVVIDNES